MTQHGFRATGGSNPSKRIPPIRSSPSTIGLIEFTTLPSDEATVPIRLSTCEAASTRPASCIPFAYDSNHTRPSSLTMISVTFGSSISARFRSGVVFSPTLAVLGLIRAGNRLLSVRARRFHLLDGVFDLEPPSMVSPLSICQSSFALGLGNFREVGQHAQ